MATCLSGKHLFLSTPAVCVLLAFSPLASVHAATTLTYAPWLGQIGVNNTIASAANWGYGQVLGVVDTGINATHPQFAPGQVSQSLSSCAALSFRCANGFNDDNGHGTAVASIAAGYRPSQFSNVTAGGYTTVAGNIIGVAPLANIVSEKVLNAAGSGYSTDVANGVKKAADAGAGVINVSITYGNDAAIVSAINYATAKGAFIVWAGGNSAQNLLNNANTTGLTPAAIQRLVFAGSVNSANAASSFTNKPGTGSLQSPTAGSNATYASRWLMAPGEAIIAPQTVAGNSAYNLWSGTSMAAPVVSGAMMLLQSTWPILKTQGTTANLLLATAKDLGAGGTDNVYGRGLVNLQTAFNPYGALTVTKTNGQTVAVSSLTGSLISSGALGSLSSIQSKLANYTAFDSYTRNFTVNLSGLIKSPSVAASVNPLPSNTYTAPKVVKYAGGEFSYAMENTEVPVSGLAFHGTQANLQRTQSTGYALFSSRDETVTALGYGASSSYPFARALYNDDLGARQMSDFDSSSIGNLAQGGYQASYGGKLGDQLRFAASYSGTAYRSASAESGVNAALPQSSQLKVGMAYRVSPKLTAGVTYGNVDEKRSLLGASYGADDALSLGQNHSQVLGLSLSYRIDPDRSVVFNTETANTRANSNQNSLLAETTAIQSRAYGFTFLQQNLLKPNDQLLASVKQPLRVTSGQVALLNAGVDAEGYPVYDKSWASLTPDGHETDFTLAYAMPAGKSGKLMLQAVYQKDAQNVAGNNKATAGLSWSSRF